MIWKIDNSDVYILGSVHALDESSNCHSESINNAYSLSDKIVFEADMDVSNHDLCSYKDNNKLKDYISKTLHKDTKKKWINSKRPYKDLEVTKIWQIANILSFHLLEKQGFSFQNGIDRILWNKAKNDSKVIDTLEQPDESLLCFDNAPLREQQKFLSLIVRKPKDVIYQFNNIVKSWQVGDTDSLANLLQDCIRELPCMFNCLIIKRNELWVNRIAESIESKTPTLFVVGVLHCVDACSIQNMIKERLGVSSLITNI